MWIPIHSIDPARYKGQFNRAMLRVTCRMKRHKSHSLITDIDYVELSAMILSFLFLETIWHHKSGLRYNPANADLFLERYETDTKLVWKVKRWVIIKEKRQWMTIQFNSSLGVDSTYCIDKGTITLDIYVIQPIWSS